MIILHEIPIYALSEKVLSKRYTHFKDNFCKTHTATDEDAFQRCVAIEAFPQCSWKHNHIVGYIDIVFDKQDISFEIYLPRPKIKKYSWRSKQKICVCNISANGAHFYVNTKMRNVDIQTKMSKMLDWMISDHIPSRFYVDKDAFDTVHRYIDYKSILKSSLKS